MSEPLDELTTDPQPDPQPAPDGAADPAADAPVTTPQDTPPQPVIDWDAPDVQERLAAFAQTQTIGVLRELGLVQDQPQPQPDGIQLDPFADDYAQQLVGLIGQALDARLGPVEQRFQAEIAQQNSEHLASTIQTVRDQVGYTPPSEEAAAQVDRQIQAAAEQLWQERAQQLPPNATPSQIRQVAESSVNDAVRFFADHDKQVAEKAVADYLASLAGDGSNLLEPGVRGSGLEGVPAPRSEADVAARFRANRAAQPV